VPAHPRLFGEHDRALGHERRYTTDGLLSEVESWIDVIDHGPLFASLVVPRAGSVAVERLRRNAGAPAARRRQLGRRTGRHAVAHRRPGGRRRDHPPPRPSGPQAARVVGLGLRNRAMTVAVVVPCYNEAARFDVEAFVELAGRVDTLMLVDDGSTDATGELLTAVEDRSGGRAEVHRLARNQGKAEAVRSGMSAAIDSGSDIIAYFDADLATPVDELLRLIDVLREHEELSVVLASRIRLLGHAIERRTSRHYLGRLYATAASLTLRLPVYDSQCGAKAFRSTPALRRAVEVPFPDAWSFDVELLARLLHPAAGSRTRRR
jgi:dolichyl-phosphate beta-glucosyltransferase